MSLGYPLHCLLQNILAAAMFHTKLLLPVLPLYIPTIRKYISTLKNTVTKIKELVKKQKDIKKRCEKNFVKVI